MGHKELDIGNTSFYDIPKINPTGGDHATGGTVKPVPGRETPPVGTMPKETASITAMPDVPEEKPAPKNQWNSWNVGGDGTWFSMYKDKE